MESATTAQSVVRGSMAGRWDNNVVMSCVWNDIHVQVSRSGPGVLVCSSSCQMRMRRVSKLSTFSAMEEEPGRIRQGSRGRTESEDTDSMTTRSFLREWRPIQRIDGQNISHY